MIEVNLDLLMVPAESYRQNKEVFDKVRNSSSEESRRILLDSLKKLPGIDLMAAPKVITKSRQKANVALVREFQYPVAFDDADAPTHFETKNPGVTFEVEPRLVGDKVVVCGSVKIVDFLGLVDEDAKTPAFQTLEVQIYQELKNGETAVVQVPSQVKETTLSDLFAKPSETANEKPGDRQLLFLLQATPVP